MSALIAGSESATPAVVSRPRPFTQEEVIQRLQEDRRVLVGALRQIRRRAPAEAPVRPSFNQRKGFDVEQYGYAVGKWEAGAIAKHALEKIGAEVDP